jgi:hypothetical protein
MPENVDLIVSLAARYRVPTLYPYPYQVAAGGLMSYGIDVVDLQGWLGHRSITSTAVYTSPSPSRFKDFWQTERLG